MSAEVDQGSHNQIQMSAQNTTSRASSTSGPKTSIFAAKSGFVIPKNKLSGSLIPIFKGTKKPGGNDAASDDSTNQVTRKSKWGPDPTQDAAVRRGRALAYQTRIDQITQQLMSEIVETEETQSFQASEQPGNSNSKAPLVNFKVSEMLKLEKREIIGEILKLNPSFKTPPDYEPLLKEATVSILVKDYPGYNFVGLIFGPGSETQKRVEKETKCKVEVFGTKASTGEKVEISGSNVSETQADFKELTVHVQADTFEKVDGAVALIEMLVTSIMESLAAGNNQNEVNQNHPSGEHEIVGLTQTPQQGQFQFQVSPVPGNSSQPSGHHLSLGFSLPQNSAPIHNNSPPLHSDPSFTGSQPISASRFSSTLTNTPFVQPLQLSPHPYPPRNFGTPAPHPSPPLLRPSLPLSGQPGQLSDRPLSSPGWFPGPPSGPWPVTPQPGFRLSTPPAVNSVSFSAGSSTVNVPMNHQLTGIGGHFPGNMGNPTHVTASRPPHSSLGDFTFRPYHPPNQPMNPDVASLTPVMQTPSFRSVVPNSMPPSPHGYPRLPIVNQMGQNQVPAFRNASPVVPPIRNFNAAPQRPDFAGNLPPRPLISPSPNIFAPNRSFVSNPGPRGGQIYDPFSPSSAK